MTDRTALCTWRTNEYGVALAWHYDNDPVEPKPEIALLRSAQACWSRNTTESRLVRRRASGGGSHVFRDWTLTASKVMRAPSGPTTVYVGNNESCLVVLIAVTAARGAEN